MPSKRMRQSETKMTRISEGSAFSSIVVALMGLSAMSQVFAQPVYHQVVLPTAPLLSDGRLIESLHQNAAMSTTITRFLASQFNITSNMAASLLSLTNNETILSLDDRIGDIAVVCSGDRRTYCYGDRSEWVLDEIGQTQSSEHSPRQVIWFAEEPEKKIVPISSAFGAISLEGHRELSSFDEAGDETSTANHEFGDEEGWDRDDSDSDDEEEDDEIYEEDTTPGLDCAYREDWMDPKNEEEAFSPSSCDAIHEIDPSTYALVNCGSSRCVFQLQDELGNDVVIKIGMFNNVNYEEEIAYANAWKDTVILEKLGWSPNILRLYGSCGTTQITEVASGGNLLDFINVARNYPERSQTPPETKLKMAFHILNAAADIHQLEAHNEDGPWMVTHNDFFPHQMLIVDGRIKLNDFHLASFAKQRNSDENDQMCLEIPSDTDDHFDKTRAPEEIRFWYPFRPKDEAFIDRSKVDVWYAGESLYHILTNRWMFEGMERNGNVRSTLRNDGTFDILLEDLLDEYTDPAEQAIIDAIEWVWSYDYRERPSAREVADFLEEQLEEIYGEDNSDNGLWRFDLPPLPADYSFTTADEEYHNNLGCPLENAPCIKRNRDAMSDWSVTVF